MTKDNPMNFLNNINKLIHEPARLMIMSYLVILGTTDFVFLLKQTELTKGNLSSHLSKLEEENYIKLEKVFQNKRPKTQINITELGMRQFHEYKNNIMNFLSIID
ncbi:MAG: transcriptional regulator [Clostridiaceae bacterium]